MKRIALGVVVVVAVGALLVHLRGCIDKSYTPPVPASQLPVVLPSNIKERVFFNTSNHSLTTVAMVNGHTVTQSSYVPRHATVDYTKTGEVSVRVQRFGVGLEPTVGFGYSDSLRLFIGTSVMYYNRFNLIVAVSGAPRTAVNIRGLLVVSYDLGFNTSLYIGAETGQTITTPRPIGGLCFRF